MDKLKRLASLLFLTAFCSGYSAKGKNIDFDKVQFYKRSFYHHLQNKNTDSVIYYSNLLINTYEEKKDTVPLLNQYFIICDYLIDNGNYKLDFELLSRYMDLAEKSRDKNHIAKAYLSIGDLFLISEINPILALEYYNKSLKLFDNKDNKGFTFKIYLRLGGYYSAIGNNTLAIEYYLKSAKLRKELNAIDALLQCYKTIAEFYRFKLRDYQNGKLYYRMALQIAEKYNKSLDKALFISELGCIDLQFGKMDSVLYYYGEGYDIFQKNGNDMTYPFIHYADYYYKIKDYGKAKYYYKKLVERFSINYKQPKAALEYVGRLSEVEEKLGNYRSAIEYQKLYRTLNDSAVSQEQLKNASRLELKFEIEDKEKGNARKLSEKELIAKTAIGKQKLTRNYFILFSILFLCIIYLIYKLYRNKTYENLELKNQRKIISQQLEENIHQKTQIQNISQKLHEADQMQLQFFTNISHELRTPLTLIISPLVKLLKGNLNEESKSVYALMLRNSRKLQSLINQLLDISKLDKGELKLNLKRYDFNKLICITASMFQTIAEEKGIDFKIIESKDSLIFCFDAECIEQILNNLLSNAFKFTQQGGQVTIIVTEENNNATVKVRDSGIGIPSESLDKVFDRFYQVESAINWNFEGSGIGLSITKSLIELHNGKINAESEPGKWTEFSFSLPMLQSESFAIVEEYHSKKTFDDALPEQKYTKTHTYKNQYTILLVEDNNDLRSYLSNSLSAEYNILEATNGTEGIEMAVKKIPDIIISDVMMPKTDGYQLTSKIKENVETSHIPIILLTAKASRNSKVEGLERGADDYINKPFDEEELFLKIKNILQNRKRLHEKLKKQIILSPSDIKVNSMDEMFLIKLTGIVEKEISEPNLDVDFLSKNIGLSRQQLYRKLKTLAGLSPNEFIRSIRIKRAAQLLSQNAGNVSEIAYMTGFNDNSYFTKRFKEEFGILPSEYQNKYS